VVKVARPRQDFRFDLPVIGSVTLESMHKAGADLLAIEAEKTLVLDMEKLLDEADRHGISVVALKDGQI